LASRDHEQFLTIRMRVNGAQAPKARLKVSNPGTTITGRESNDKTFPMRALPRGGERLGTGTVWRESGENLESRRGHQMRDNCPKFNGRAGT
jgi:hypothetical protein